MCAAHIFKGILLKEKQQQIKNTKNNFHTCNKFGF